jgi:hypothetical protein
MEKPKHAMSITKARMSFDTSMVFSFETLTPIATAKINIDDGNERFAAKNS